MGTTSPSSNSGIRTVRLDRKLFVAGAENAQKTVEEGRHLASGLDPECPKSAQDSVGASSETTIHEVLRQVGLWWKRLNDEGSPSRGCLYGSKNSVVSTL
jgi:hypothetical protein